MKDSSVSNDKLDSTLNLSQNLEILEKEILLLREENLVLKTAHDRLIEKFFIYILFLVYNIFFSSIEHDSISNNSIEELNRLKGQIDSLQKNLIEQTEIRKNSDLRVSFLQSEILKLQGRNEKLREKLQASNLDVHNLHKSKEKNILSDEDDINSQHSEFTKKHFDDSFNNLIPNSKVFF